MWRTQPSVGSTLFHWRVDWWARIGGQMNPWMELTRTLCLAWLGLTVVALLLVIWLGAVAPDESELRPKEDRDGPY